MAKPPDELVRRLQQSAQEWKTPRAIPLDGPGPFSLPLCGHVSGSGSGSDPQVVLELEVVKSFQTVRVSIEGGQIVALKAIVDAWYGQYVSALKQS